MKLLWLARQIGSLFAALDVNKNGYITATQLNELLCSDASRARTTAIRLKKSLSQKLQSGEQIEELFEEAAHGANYVNLAQFRHIVAAGLDAEVAEVGATLAVFSPCVCC